jgi:hypothetical protein
MKVPGCWLRTWIGAAVLWTCGLAVHADVIVVDNPGFGFGIQNAVNAAAEGDTILVRNGTYGRFTITAKSLTVIADGTAVMIQAPTGQTSGVPSIEVKSLGPGQTVLVRGFRTNMGYSVSDCAGSVWFEDMLCTGGTADCTFVPVHGALVRSSASVTFTRCELLGELGGPSTLFGVPESGAGLSAQSSTVQLFDCRLTGGYGESTGWILDPAPGAPGIKVETSTVTIAGCTIRGGAGGLRTNALCSGPHAPGGAGVEFAGGAGIVRSAASTAVGGVASLGPMCPGQSAPAGPAIAGSGTIVALPGLARELRAKSPVRGGQPLRFDVTAQAGEVPLVLVSLDHAPAPWLKGTLLVGLPLEEVLVLAPLPPSGKAAVTFPAPNVGPLVGSIDLYAQAAFLASGQALWLGTGTSVVLLDAGL